MKEVEKIFRVSLSGFNKQDVISYLEKMAAERKTAIEEKDKDIEQLRADEGENNRLIAELRTQLAEAQRIGGAFADTAKELRTSLSAASLRVSAAFEALEEERAKAVQQENMAKGLAQQVELLEKQCALLSEENARLSAVKTRQEEATEARAAEALLRRQDGEGSAEELFDLFKLRASEVSKELMLLAQAVKEAEEREIYRLEQLNKANEPRAVQTQPEGPKITPPVGPTVTPSVQPQPDAPQMPSQPATAPRQAPSAPPPPSAPVRPAQGSRLLTVREILDRVKNIGDKVL